MKKLLALLLLVPILAFAWEPTRPVTAIVGNTPGAGNEIAFRKLVDIVQKKHPEANFVIINMPGADSVIANNKVFESAPDGYTINLPSHMSSYVTNDIWEANVKRYQWDSFSDVMTIGKSPLVLVASAYSDVNTPQDFIKRINTTKQPINIAVGGGAHRTAFEYLIEKGHGNRELIRPIKFNGPMPAVLSVLQYKSDRPGTEFGIMPIAVARSLLETGKIKAIGFTGTRKMPQYPDVPLLNTVAPGINVYAAWSIQLPPNTPKEIIDWYTRVFGEAVRSEEYKEWCRLNIIFYEESELTTAGLRKHMTELRTTFLPVLSKLDLSKD